MENVSGQWDNIGMRLRSAVILSLSLVMFGLQPAHAIFGLSKCEKINQQLNTEQAIGFENWKIFDEYRDGLIKKGSFTWADLQPALNKLKIVKLSDQQIFKIVENNNSCFTPKFLADNRENIDSTANDLNSIAKANAALNKATSDGLKLNATRDFFNWLKIVYKDFHDWKTNKILKK